MSRHNNLTDTGLISYEDYRIMHILPNTTSLSKGVGHVYIRHKISTSKSFDTDFF